LKKDLETKIMPAKRYKVTLTVEEREELTQLVSQGKASARKITRARILLLADESQAKPAWLDARIAEALGISSRTVERIRQTCVEEGIETALNHKRPKRTRSKTLDGKAEAHLVQLACSEPPNGRERWTMQMLADKLIELEIVETVSDETVRTTLKKMNSNRG
jgi:transposase